MRKIIFIIAIILAVAFFAYYRLTHLVSNLPQSTPVPYTPETVPIKQWPPGGKG